MLVILNNPRRRYPSVPLVRTLGLVLIRSLQVHGNFKLTMCDEVDDLAEHPPSFCERTFLQACRLPNRRIKYFVKPVQCHIIKNHKKGQKYCWSFMFLITVIDVIIVIKREVWVSVRVIGHRFSFISVTPAWHDICSHSLLGTYNRLVCKLLTDNSPRNCCQNQSLIQLCLVTFSCNRCKCVCVCVPSLQNRHRSDNQVNNRKVQVLIDRK